MEKLQIIGWNWMIYSCILDVIVVLFKESSHFKQQTMLIRGAIDGCADRLVSSGGCVSTQRIEPGVDHIPSAFSRGGKGSRDDRLWSFEFISIKNKMNEWSF